MTSLTYNNFLCLASDAAKSNPDTARKLRLWAADCAARVLPFYEEKGASDAPRKAIIAARQFARGEIDDPERESAWRAALTASVDVSGGAYSAASAAESAAAWDAPLTAARNAASAPTSAAAWSAERQWQFDRLIAWMSDDEPEDWPLSTPNQ